ncbi:MAG: hypothetical protein CVV59_00670 [Tenericutes bacterium HGW-Tenericutes-4]|nr:MAG: hypothetical protein CVV59_00670 [Tenericutes bacterium HGW-Tenericutes-4]
MFFLLFLPLGINVNIFFNFFKNLGEFKVKFFNKLKLIQLSLYVKNGKLFLKGRKKEKQIDLKLSDENLIFYNEIQKSILKKIMLKKFQINLYVGIKDNPFLTSMLSGQLQMILGMVFGYLHTKNKEGRTITSVHTNFNEEMLVFEFSGKIYVSIITIFLSIIEAYFRKNKKYEVQKQYGK